MIEVSTVVVLVGKDAELAKRLHYSHSSGRGEGPSGKLHCAVPKWYKYEQTKSDRGTPLR